MLRTVFGVFRAGGSLRPACGDVRPKGLQPAEVACIRMCPSCVVRTGDSPVTSDVSGAKFSRVVSRRSELD